MADHYVPVQWNSEKKRYDGILLTFIIAYLTLFLGLQWYFYPEGTLETRIIRSTGTLAFLLLTIVLAIGPLCRLNPRFLPLLYNRRHLGVATFLIGLIHGIFNLIQFHSLGNVGILTSLFTSNTQYGSFAGFPFQVLGFTALCILFLMAATSHDFWLKNLTPGAWKRLHMLVYLAYVLLVGHIALGILQNQLNVTWISILSTGVIPLIVLHLAAARKNHHEEVENARSKADWIHVGSVDSIPDQRARIIYCGDESIAIFKYDQQIAAVSNVCRHQHGPLGEGKVVDGCITCPWHGYQYYPHNGQSPPPYTEKIETYRVRIDDGQVYVDPHALPPGTACAPVPIDRSFDSPQGDHPDASS
ncbi:MAG: ferric reductase-like transmembrane domain-containing protein [Saprospiraceae bacterium]|nr:ferric reductase-like transmembrane domain-containing protein [Saprospiraceae bacterium]